MSATNTHNSEVKNAISKLNKNLSARELAKIHESVDTLRNENNWRLLNDRRNYDKNFEEQFNAFYDASDKMLY